MSWVLPGEPGGELVDFNGDKRIIPFYFSSADCFLCARAITSDNGYVYWAGSTMEHSDLGEQITPSSGGQYIVFHEDCAQRFAQKLLFDVSCLSKGISKEQYAKWIRTESDKK
jgi:hypothetical protein